MFAKLLVLFISIPLAEILILIKLGETFGFWPTVLLVIVTGFLGAVIARIEGFRTWNNIQHELREGRIPGEKLIDALLLLVAGLLLITPGLLTDLSGFFLLIPATRFSVKRWLRKKFDELIKHSRKSGAPDGFRILIK